MSEGVVIIPERGVMRHGAEMEVRLTKSLMSLVPQPNFPSSNTGLTLAYLPHRSFGIAVSIIEPSKEYAWEHSLG